MQREMISKNQMICMILLFLFGSNAIMGGSWNVGQDAWISILIALAAGSVLVLIYARIICLFPEQNFYDISQIIFGRVIGKIIIIFMIWYAIHLSAILLRLLSEFVKIVNLQKTPQWAMMILLLAVTGYMVLSGIRTLGRWAVFTVPLYLIIVLYMLILSSSEIKVSNILPIMEHNIAALGSAGLKILTTTFASTVLFLGLADSIKKKDNPYKIYLYGIFMGAVVLLIVFFLNIMFLGVPMVEKSYFPSYVAARIVNMGDFLSRIEIIVYYNFLLAGIAKISICLLAAIKGVETLFNITNKGLILLVISILSLVVGINQFDSVSELFNFTNVFQYYVLPFQVLIPIIVWIGAEIKIGRERSRSR